MDKINKKMLGFLDKVNHSEEDLLWFKSVLFSCDLDLRSAISDESPVSFLLKNKVVVSPEIIFNLVSKSDFNKKYKDNWHNLFYLIKYNKENDLCLSGDQLYLLLSKTDLSYTDQNNLCLLTFVFINNFKQSLFLNKEQISGLLNKQISQDNTVFSPLCFLISNSKKFGFSGDEFFNFIKLYDFKNDDDLNINMILVHDVLNRFKNSNIIGVGFKSKQIVYILEKLSFFKKRGLIEMFFDSVEKGFIKVDSADLCSLVDKIDLSYFNGQNRLLEDVVVKIKSIQDFYKINNCVNKDNIIKRPIKI